MSKNTCRILTFLIFAFSSSTTFSQDIQISEIDSNNRRPKELSIKDAFEQGLLEFKIFGAFDPFMFEEVIDQDGIHYGKCMGIILKSKVDTLIFLRLEQGTQLIPLDSSVQTMIVTQNATFPLFPNRPLATRFYAMCGQFHDAAPTVETLFEIGALADSEIVKLASYLGKNHIQNIIGQHAMWAITDQANFDELKDYGADSLSIASTKQILNSLNLVTKLTPESEKEAKVETNEISVNRYYIFTGMGLLIIATITIVVLIVRRKKNDEIIT